MPEHAPTFLRLTLCGAWVTGMGNTLLIGVLATGNIKSYQLWVTMVGCLVFPLTWIAFKGGLPAHATYVIYIMVYYLLVFVRLVMARKILGIPIKDYLREVVLLTFAVTLIAFTIPIMVVHLMNTSFVRLCVTILSALLSTFWGIYIVGLGSSEKKKVIFKVKSILKKYMHNL